MLRSDLVSWPRTTLSTTTDLARPDRRPGVARQPRADRRSSPCCWPWSSIARLTDMVSNWDVQHFNRLAARRLPGRAGRHPDGLLPRPAGAALGVPPARDPAGGQRGGPRPWPCSAVAAAALLRLGGPWAAVAWLFAPTAVFTTVPYTESLFCAAGVLGLGARPRRPLAAGGGLAALACTVRVSGVFLIGALLVMIITGRAPVTLKLAPDRADAACRSRWWSLFAATCTASPAAGPPGITPSRPAGCAS